MMVFHLKFSKKYLAFALILVLLAAAAAVLLGGCLKKEAAPAQAPAVNSNEARVQYLTDLGWEVTAEPKETLHLLLPEDLSAAYGDYCKLQQEQQLPFDQYGGRQVTRYTYTITNYPDVPGGVQANLYICDDHVIGGDIIATGENGFQQGLRYPS